MKRSVTLLVSNILTTLYCAVLLWIYVGAIISAGGVDFLEAIGASFHLAFDYLGLDSSFLIFVYIFSILLCIHVVLFTLGCLIAWISYASKSSGGAKFAATLYLLGTIAFPIYLFFGLPLTIVGYCGGGSQKKYNLRVIDVPKAE